MKDVLDYQADHVTSSLPRHEAMQVQFGTLSRELLLHVATRYIRFPPGNDPITVPTLRGRT